MLVDALFRELYNIAVIRDHSRASLGRSLKTAHDLPECKTNFNFYDDVLQNFMYCGPKSMSGIRVIIRKVLDLIDQIRTLERTMAVCSQLDSEL
jgi:hypothetical protein